MAYDPDNIFARILRGTAPCIPVYEDEETLAFMDIMPEAEGHVLVVPKEPAETLFDLSERGAQACIRTTRLVGIAVKKALGKPGVYISQLNGAEAGQTVPHCHFHVIPCTAETTYHPHATVRADDEELREIAARIRACLA
ncbi:HIT family protein [Achromobacter aloeverae]